MIAAPPMSLAQIDARLDELFTKMGTTQQEVAAEHGSLGAFANALRISLKPVASNGNTGKEVQQAAKHFQ
jgi:hypothetical protein